MVVKISKLFWIIVVFLVIGGIIIYNSTDSDLSTKDGKTSYAKRFGKWIGQLGGNVKDVTTYAIKKDWLPENGSNETVTYNIP